MTKEPTDVTCFNYMLSWQNLLMIDYIMIENIAHKSNTLLYNLYLFYVVFFQLRVLQRKMYTQGSSYQKSWRMHSLDVSYLICCILVYDDIKELYNKNNFSTWNVNDNTCYA
jgi:hypothetical protein